MTFEILQTENGTFNWRLRAADGRLVQIKPGVIKLPAATASKRKRIKAATQHALKLAANKAAAKA